MINNIANKEEAYEFLVYNSDHYSLSAFDSEVNFTLGLSSGLDSSYLAKLAKEYFDSQFIALSLGYDRDTENDESIAAQNFCIANNISHSSFVANSSNFIYEYLKTISLVQEPIADFAAQFYSNIYTCARSQIGCKVIVMGHGADELSIGYGWMFGALNHYRTSNLFSLYETNSDFRYYYTRMQYVSSLTRDFYSFSAPSAFLTSDSYFANSLISIVCDTWLQNSSLKLADRLSMSQSVECRSPLLNERIYHHLSQLFQYIPESLDLQKGLFKKIFSSRLGEDQLLSKKKYFEPPRAHFYSLLYSFFSRQIKSDNSIAESFGILRNGVFDHLFSQASNAELYYWLNKLLKLELSLISTLDPLRFRKLLELSLK